MTQPTTYHYCFRLMRLLGWVGLALCALGIVLVVLDMLAIHRWHRHWSDVPYVLIIAALAGLAIVISGHLLKNAPDGEK